jgi:hypothetical protein
VIKQSVESGDPGVVSMVNGVLDDSLKLVKQHLEAVATPPDGTAMQLCRPRQAQAGTDGGSLKRPMKLLAFD